MLWKKADVKAEKREQTVKTSQVFIEETATDFREPVVYCCKNNKNSAAKNNIMEVGHNKIGVMDMNIKRNLSQGDSCDSAKNKIENESTTEQQCTVQGKLALPEGGQPVKKFDAGWYSNNGRRNCEK